MSLTFTEDLREVTAASAFYPDHIVLIMSISIPIFALHDHAAAGAIMLFGVTISEKGHLLTLQAPLLADEELGAGAQNADKSYRSAVVSSRGENF